MYFDVTIIEIKNQLNKLIIRAKAECEKEDVTTNKLKALDTLNDSLILIITLRDIISEYEKGMTTLRKDYNLSILSNTKLKKENKALKEQIKF